MGPRGTNGAGDGDYWSDCAGDSFRSSAGHDLPDCGDDVGIWSDYADAVQESCGNTEYTDTAAGTGAGVRENSPKKKNGLPDELGSPRLLRRRGKGFNQEA